MKKHTVKSFILKALVVLLGTAVCAYGINLVLCSGVGVDPLTMFEEGLAKQLGIEVAYSNWGVNMTVLLIGFLINRKSVGWGTFITAFCMGPCMKLLTPLTPAAPSGFWWGLVMNVIGVAVIGLGIAIYMSPNFGVGAMETIMTFFSEKLHKPYSVVRICIDCTWLLLGLLLHGTFGVGTIIGAFGVGFTLDLFYRLIHSAFLKRKAE